MVENNLMVHMVTMQQLIFHTSSVASLELQLLPKDVQQSQCHQWVDNLLLVDNHHKVDLEQVGRHLKMDRHLNLKSFVSSLIL
jgi:hypothetical protein